MNLQGIVIVGLVILSASGTSGEPDFKKSVPNHFYQRDTPPCNDCESKGEITAIVTGLGSLANAAFQIIQAVLDEVKKLPEIQTTPEELTSVLKVVQAKVPDILKAAKDTLKNLAACSQVDELYTNLNANIVEFIEQVVKAFPALVKARNGGKLPEQVTKTIGAMKPISTKLFEEMARNLAGMLGICSSLVDILKLVPTLVDTFLGVVATVLNARVSQTISQILTGLLAEGLGKIPEKLLKALPTLLSGVLAGDTPKDLTEGLQGMAGLVECVVNFMIVVIKAFLAKKLPPPAPMGGLAETLTVLLKGVLDLVTRLLSGLTGG